MKLKGALMCAVLFQARVKAHVSPLPSHDALWENEMQWIAAVNEAPGKYKGPPIKESYSQLGVSDPDTIKNIATTLFCASERLTPESNKCSSLKELIPGLLYMLQDGDNGSLYFGYTFFINVPRLGDLRLRNLIYDQAKLAWDAVKEEAIKHPTYEQFHIGFGTGGSLASLIAHRLLIVPSLPFHFIGENAHNQIKVVTISEYAMFTTRVQNNPIGLANYASFYQSGVERQSPSKFSYHGVQIALTSYHSEKTNSQVPIERLIQFLSLKEEASTRLKSLSGSKYRRIQHILARDRETVANVVEDIEKIFKENGKVLYGVPHVHCAAELENILNEYLPHFKESPIVCTANQSRKGKELPPAEFQIKCMLQSQPKGNDESTVIAQYEGRVANYNERDKLCKALKKNIDQGEEWSRCFRALVNEGPYLKLISPHSTDGSGNCKFLTNTINGTWNKKPMGCVIKPVTSDPLLERIYDNDPDTFYSLIDMEITAFPKQCQDILMPIWLKGTSLKEAKKSLDIIVSYLEELQDGAIEEKEKPPKTNTQSRKDRNYRIPDLFQAHSTKSFNTRELKLSNGHFVADNGTADSILRCVSSRKTQFLDCREDANRWIPGACPDFCSKTDKNENGMAICGMIASCPAIKGYVGLAEVELPQLKKALMEPIQRILQSSSMAQYALYHFYSKTGFLRQYLPTKDYYFGIFFDEAPEVGPVNQEELRQKKNPQETTVNDAWDDYLRN